MSEVQSIDWRKSEHQEALQAALKKALNVLHEIDNTSHLGSWLVKVLVGLVQATQFSYTNLTSGSKTENIAFCAWSARTLLEAEIWMEYVIASTSNAQRFHDDWINDVSELFDCSVPYSEMNPQQQAGMSVLYEQPDADRVRASGARETLEKFKDAAATDDEEYLRVASVARELGHSAWFSKYNKVLSKYVHATALSVLSFPTPRSRTHLANLLLYNGSNSCVRVVGSLNAFLNKRGLPEVF